MNRFLLITLLRGMCLIIPFLVSHISFANPTHMGVEPQEMISLILVCEESDEEEVCKFKRTLNSGPTQADFFTIPDDKVLVVTDLDWKYRNAIAFGLKNQLIEFQLKRTFFCLGDPNLCPQPPVKSYAVAAQFGPIIGGTIFASGNVQMTTGFVVSWPSELVVRVLDMSGNFLPIHGNFAKLDVTVRGYLLPATCGIPGTPPCP